MLQNLLTFGPVDERVLRILVIIGLALISRLIIISIANSVVKAITPETPRGKRLRTLSTIFSNTTTMVVSLVFFFMILKEIGFDITPLLASAGVAGIALGFGAQTLVKDSLSGFFLLLDDQFGEGDLVEINGKKGEVEKITLRNIEIRDSKGTIHIIPAGSITLVSNFSKR